VTENNTEPPAAAAATTTTATIPLPPSAAPAPSSYYAMVVDSGPIIKQDVRNLMGKADLYVTTPSVLREIRDSRARDHLEHSVLPLLDLKVREPSDKAIQDVIAFAKQTGDYASLSTVDLQVLALTLDLEREGNLVAGNTDLEHIRTTPKRKIGLGTILPMNNAKQKDDAGEEKKGEDGDADAAAAAAAATAVEAPKLLGREDYDEVEDSDESDDDEDHVEEEGEDVEDSDQSDNNNNNNNNNEEEEADMRSVGEGDVASPVSEPAVPVRKTWATLVNPIAASASVAPTDPARGLSLAPMTLRDEKEEDEDGGAGQFDDASEDGGGEQNDDQKQQTNATTITTVEEELQLDFPSLTASVTVPFEGEDHEIEARLETEAKTGDGKPKAKTSVFMTEEEKQKNLQPLSKSGRIYNSFRKDKGLFKPKPVKKKAASVEEQDASPIEPLPAATGGESPGLQAPSSSSRFLSGGGGGETMRAEDDDGLGWITSASDIEVLKTEAGGRLDPGKTGGSGNSNNNNGNNNRNNNRNKGLPMNQRTACATTDFAMQNVLLQMNLILLSTNGMRIRRLKSWVIRCGACFKIHGADEDFRDETNHHVKRLFCSHCGSGDMMQRISASVDGKTGRLKLHFSKRKQGRHHSIRGTKFSLPKPGSGNKYKGDLLLREDQLLSGAWNQKVKINSGRKYQQNRSESMFGKDIASSVGCNMRSTSSATFGGKGWSNSTNTVSGGFGSSSDDIRVGFGARKNPNAAKGRERRGKKKKSSDRACGMRRY